jgi:transposase
VKSGVRVLNQRTAIFRSNGIPLGEKLPNPIEQFVLDGLTKAIESYYEEKKRYEKKFKELAKQHSKAGLLMSLPGIAEINAKARSAVARRLAVLALGVLRSGKKFEPSRRKQDVADQS